MNKTDESKPFDIKRWVGLLLVIAAALAAAAGLEITVDDGEITVEEIEVSQDDPEEVEKGETGDHTESLTLE